MPIWASGWRGFGYDTGVLDSFTYEEANTRLGNWMRQRARWLKGFLMTWLVHMREPVPFMREVGPAGFWAAQVADARRLRLGAAASPLHGGDGRCSTCSIRCCRRAAGWCSCCWPASTCSCWWRAMPFPSCSRGARCGGVASRGWRGTLATMPLYWMLMSVAAWMALWQFITRPFHWNKTEHGLSSVQRVRPRQPRGTG